MELIIPMEFLSIFASIVSAMVIFLLQSQIKENRKLIKEREEERGRTDKAIENGVRQLLSVRLEEIYEKYKDAGSIPKVVFDRWCKLMGAYKNLHGNGTFDHMNKEIVSKHIN